MTVELVRFRQSLAKTLLGKSPAHVAWELTEERRKATSKMNRGTLIDQLVFGQTNYHTVTAPYASGPRKGQPAEDWTSKAAKDERAAAEERGQLPVLQHELDNAREVAGGIRAALMAEDIDLSTCVVQHTIQWDGPGGVKCEGTPDLYFVHRDEEGAPICVDTIDLKTGDNANPEWLDGHVHAMGWDIQAAAYQEAVHSLFPEANQRGQHWLLVAECEGPRCITFEPLSSAYMDIGYSRWTKACLTWKQCIETGVWPEYPKRPISPSRSVMFKEGLTQ